MRKLAIRLLALLIGAILVLLAVVILERVSPGYSECAANATDIALKTALKDPSVAEVLSWPDAHYTASINPVTADAEKGYLNGPANLTDVKIQVRYHEYASPYRFDVIVDGDRKKVMNTIGMLDIASGDDFMTIPAGSAWYYHIVRANAIGGGYLPLPPMLVRGSYSPTDARVLLALVDGEGFKMLRNAAANGDLQHVDLSGHALWLNRSGLVGPEWDASINVPYVNVSAPVVSIMPGGKTVSTLPEIKPADDYYFVIANEDSREVSATFWPDSTTFF